MLVFCFDVGSSYRAERIQKHCLLRRNTNLTYRSTVDPPDSASRLVRSAEVDIFRNMPIC